jgi:transposase-like protein
MESFKGTDLIVFTEYFISDDICKKYLAELKWANGFKCSRCGHSKYVERAGHRRMCQKCKTTESSTSNTLLHDVRFGLRKAFMIMFEMATISKGISSLQISKRYSISYNTALSFTRRIRKAMKSSNNYPLDGLVNIDEFVIGAKEKGKQGRSSETEKSKVVVGVELTEKDSKKKLKNGVTRRGIKRAYFQIIDNFSTVSLQDFFVQKVSTEAKVVTDKWKGYLPLKKEYSITQEESLEGMNFPELHIVIHQVKTWIRTIFSGVSKKYIQSYLDEFSFRFNRSIFRETIFHKLIERKPTQNCNL